MAANPNPYDFSAFAGSATNGNQGGLAGQAAGMSFLGGSGSGIPAAAAPGAGAPSGNPFASAPAAGASMMAASGSAGGAPAGSSADLTSLLSQSPFGVLLNLPGVTAANLFSNVNPANYGSGNPFAVLGSSLSSGAYGGNPFAAIEPYVNQAVASGTSAIPTTFGQT